jgi:hypothetical protein
MLRQLQLGHWFLSSQIQHTDSERYEESQLGNSGLPVEWNEEPEFNPQEVVSI